MTPVCLQAWRPAAKRRIVLGCMLRMRSALDLHKSAAHHGWEICCRMGRGSRCRNSSSRRWSTSRRRGGQPTLLAVSPFMVRHRCLLEGQVHACSCVRMECFWLKILRVCIKQGRRPSPARARSLQGGKVSVSRVLCRCCRLAGCGMPEHVGAAACRGADGCRRRSRNFAHPLPAAMRWTPSGFAVALQALLNRRPAPAQPPDRLRPRAGALAAGVPRRRAALSRRRRRWEPSIMQRFLLQGLLRV